MSAHRSTPHELGDLRRRYTSRWPLKELVAIVILFLLPGIGSLFLDHVLLRVSGLMMFGIAIGAMVFAVNKSTLAIDVYERGFVWREAGKALTVPWSDL